MTTTGISDCSVVLTDMANHLLTKHELKQKGWSFRFATSKSVAGWCKHRYKRIELSVYYVISATDYSHLYNTLLHEIAHALVGTSNGHNHVWRYKALSIGCNAKRCSSLDSSAPPRYVATCKHCGKVHKWFRKPKAKKHGCGICSRTYNDKYRLTIERYSNNGI